MGMASVNTVGRLRQLAWRQVARSPPIVGPEISRGMKIPVPPGQMMLYTFVALAQRPV